jgi:hypothetical protein
MPPPVSPWERLLDAGNVSPPPPSGSQPPEAAPWWMMWMNLGPTRPGGPDQWELIPKPRHVLEAEGLLRDDAQSSLASAQLQAATANRRINLDRAIASLGAFNQAQRSADERRVAAIDQARLLSGLLVPKGTEFFPGMGPSGALAQASERAGLEFAPSRVVEREFQPQALADAPDIPPQVAAMLQGLQAI